MSAPLTSTQFISELRKKSQAINPTPLIKREFINIGSESDFEETDGDVIRIMQWNLLAQGLCQGSDGFVLCPFHALDWDFRQHHIMEELLSYTADIYCLEEMDHFSDVLHYLSRFNFAGVFFPKPDSPCLYQANNDGPDGCGVFWRKNKFNLVSSQNIILHDDRNKETNQVAIMCTFQGKAGYIKEKKIICVVTHLKSKQGYENMRWQQGKYLEKLLREKAAGVPLILCGDFNAEPQEKVVSVIKDSPLGLCSAYTLLSSEGAEPPYTTWKVRRGRKGQAHEEICHTIDYLFFTSKDFQCIRLLKLPTAEEIGPTFLPSYSYPSDHLSLVADLKLIS